MIYMLTMKMLSHCAFRSEVKRSRQSCWDLQVICCALHSSHCEMKDCERMERTEKGASLCLAAGPCRNFTAISGCHIVCAPAWASFGGGRGKWFHTVLYPNSPTLISWARHGSTGAHHKCEAIAARHRIRKPFLFPSFYHSVSLGDAQSGSRIWIVNQPLMQGASS